MADTRSHQFTYGGLPIVTTEANRDGQVYCCEYYGTYLVYNYLRDGDTFVDVGANIGCYTLFGAEAVGPTGKVIAIEPAKSCYDLLCENIKANNFNNVTTIMAAASDKSSKSQELYDFGGGDSAYQLWKDPDRKLLSVGEIDVITVDDLNLDKVNVLKIDTQGYEFRTLKGAKETIKRQKKMAVLIEFWLHGLKGVGDFPNAMLQLLTELNFDIHIISDVVPVGIRIMSGSEILTVRDYMGGINLWCMKAPRR